jgi:hypothetical protein
MAARVISSDGGATGRMMVICMVDIDGGLCDTIPEAMDEIVGRVHVIASIIMLHNHHRKI